MKSVKIKQWQLLKWKKKTEIADLREERFLTLGKHSFRKNRRIEEIRLPSTVSAIKAEALLGCRRLSEITLSTEANVGISMRAFYGCGRLHRVENDRLISYIGNEAFRDCRMLGEIHFGKELRKIGEQAFAGCTSLRALHLPSNVTTVGRGAFRFCTELSELTFDPMLSALSPEMFRECISLKEISLPRGIRELPVGCFRDCSALCEITVPGNVLRIGKRAFAGCSRLERVTLELGVERIDAKAFADTPRLREIFLPRTVKRIGHGAFGLEKREEKLKLLVENEYMLRRIRRLVWLAGCAANVEVVLFGKTIEERKRERRRSTVEQKPVHLFGRDGEDAEENAPEEQPSDVSAVSVEENSAVDAPKKSENEN